MNIDLNRVPFSRADSFLAFSHYSQSPRPYGGTGGLYLRTLHGACQYPELFRLTPIVDGQPVAYTFDAQPWELTLHTAAGDINICFAQPRVVLLRGKGEKLGIRLDEIVIRGIFNYVHEVPFRGKLPHLINCFESNCRIMAINQQGGLSVEQEWNERQAESCSLDFTPQGGGFLAILEEISTEWEGHEADYDYDAAVAQIRGEYERFCAGAPTVPAEYEEARRFAAYVNWESVVPQSGFLKRRAMLMSKNWMNNVWSWDHCFNALATAYGDPAFAWDQFMLLFDYQDESGLLPDSVNDRTCCLNFCKPPVHGWALSLLMQIMPLSMEQKKEASNVLKKWTLWWLRYRDHDGDGICEYYHGNDSGWDNSTVFRVVPPIESPDLSAFLVVQMDVLSELARDLGDSKEEMHWRARADWLLACMCKHCFDENGDPRVVTSRTHEPVENQSLLPYLPVVLGNRLPEKIRNRLVETLKSDRFLTDYGFATESPQSPDYLPNGYWRGPIWAPSTLLLVDGLRRCGEEAVAREVAKRFCQMARQSGFAENYDALTGEGLCDGAYTWTSSVFLVLAHEYLGPEEKSAENLLS